MRLITSLVLLLSAVVVFAQDEPTMVYSSFNSTVGILLSDYPASLQEMIAQRYSQGHEEYWKQRAKKQVEYTSYILTWRMWYHEENQHQLPPNDPSLWRIELTSETFELEQDSLKFICVNYSFHTVLLSRLQTLNASEPALGTIGGTWVEDFYIPIDPDYLFQRTGYACADEDEFPPGVVDSWNAHTFYDQYCEVEDEETQSCHYTEFPQETCIEAVTRSMGILYVPYLFERIEWDDALADEFRTGHLEPTPANLQVNEQRLRNNRIVYEYFPEDDCVLLEKCVASPGWRRLLMFDATATNIGSEPMHVGAVENGTFAELLEHNVYEWGECHGHWHFQFYANYTLSSNHGNKMAWCLESIIRVYNNEDVPMNSEYYTCGYQGIQHGWADEYIAGIDCQWIDITDVTDTFEATLAFEVNPEGFLCEGEPIVNETTGDRIFEPTPFVTSIAGKPIDRPLCNYTENYIADNTGTLLLNVSTSGIVASPCADELVGHMRDCGFTEIAWDKSCTAGEPVELELSVQDTNTPMVVRFCESSRALSTGIECTYRDSLATVIVLDKADVQFTCPEARDAVETGGIYSIYTAPFATFGNTQAVSISDKGAGTTGSSSSSSSSSSSTTDDAIIESSSVICTFSTFLLSLLSAAAMF